MKVERTGRHVRIELTRRNLTALLAKLDDPASARTLTKHSDDGQATAWIVAVEDDAHYSDRPPGAVYMPTTGESY